MTIAEKLKRCAADPAVQERRRKIQTMYYLYKNNADTMQLILYHMVVNQDLPSEHDRWEVQLTETTPTDSDGHTYKKVIGSQILLTDPLMASDFRPSL